jgi:hypothetical protein
MENDGTKWAYLKNKRTRASARRAHVLDKV